MVNINMSIINFASNTKSKGLQIYNIIYMSNITNIKQHNAMCNNRIWNKIVQWLSKQIIVAWKTASRSAPTMNGGHIRNGAAPIGEAVGRKGGKQ